MNFKKMFSLDISRVEMACLFTMFCMTSIMAVGCVSPNLQLLEKKQQNVLDSYRLYISESIDEPERAKKLVVIGEGIYQQIQIDTRILYNMTKELEDLNNSYDARREEIEAALQAINQHRRKIREKILAARTAVLSLTTPEEWQGLMTRRKTMMDLLRGTPGII